MNRLPDGAAGRRRRVLHVIGALPMGGAETALYRLLTTSPGGDFEPWVLSLKDRGALGDALAERGVGVLSLGLRRPLPGPVALLRFAGLVRHLRPALVVGWMYYGNLAADLARLCLGGVPMVWNVRHTPQDLSHEGFANRWAIRLGARRAGAAAAVVYNSQASAERHGALGYPRRRSTVLPNGFDCRRFRPSSAARQALRRRLGVGEDALLVGRVGRFHPVKDYATFVTACGLLAPRHAALHAVLAGPGVDADNAQLGAWIDRAGLAGRSHLLGPVAEMPQLLAALDLLCSSSLGESFPNVVAEAMACGVPCVVTDVGASRELVGDTGRVVPPSDAEAMAAALGELLDLAAAARRDLGGQARQRVESRYSAAAVYPRYERIWREALAAPE